MHPGRSPERQAEFNKQVEAAGNMVQIQIIRHAVVWSVVNLHNPDPEVSSAAVAVVKFLAAVFNIKKDGDKPTICMCCEEVLEAPNTVIFVVPADTKHQDTHASLSGVCDKCDKQTDKQIVDWLIKRYGMTDAKMIWHEGGRA